MERNSSEPILILRENNKKFKQKQKLLNKRIKSKRFLRKQIDSNHKIFQSNIDLYRNMTAQNLIWDKNYKFKCTINKIKQQNSALKARIWNIQKQNRKMQRQLQSWSINQQQCLNLTKKPYIDMSTFQKVIKDQDYNIVSMKIQICQLQNLYKERQAQLQSNLKKQKQKDKLLSFFNHEIASKKMQIYQLIDSQYNKNIYMSDEHNQKKIKDKLSNIIINQNLKIDLIQKNMQIKRRSKINIENDLVLMRSECQLVKNVNFQEIERLTDQIKEMRRQEIGGINSQKEKIKKIRKEILELECQIQTKCDQKIKEKIQITREINRITQALTVLTGTAYEPKTKTTLDKSSTKTNPNAKNQKKYECSKQNVTFRQLI